MKSVRLLISDLDNTLYDWVTFFARSFTAMVDTAVDVLEVNRETLLDELQQVHRSYQNSEQPYALLETRTVLDRLAHLSRAERAEFLDSAFHAFNSARKSTLALYPGVQETLERVRADGGIVVGHTEATAHNAQFRLHLLGIAPLFDRLYAVANQGEGHPRPERAVEVTPIPYVRFLNQDERKPDPRVLLDICRDTSVKPQEALYVGDSIARDIGMAKEAGLKSAWARYGTSYRPEDWATLVRVTHWTDEDVRRAKWAQDQYGKVKPDIVLEQSMSELLKHFEFGAKAKKSPRRSAASGRKPLSTIAGVVRRAAH